MSTGHVVRARTPSCVRRKAAAALGARTNPVRSTECARPRTHALSPNKPLGQASISTDLAAVAENGLTRLEKKQSPLSNGRFARVPPNKHSIQLCADQ